VTSIFERLAKDALMARMGDTEATLRLARNGLPILARRLHPGLGIVASMAGAAWDLYAKDEVRGAPADGNYSTPGAGRFTRWLVGLKDGVVVVIGAPGQGKTATLCALADRWSTASHRYIVGVDPEALVGTPLEPFSWNATRIRQLPPRSVLLVPDSGLYLDSRDFGTSAEQAVRQLAAIARHRSVRILLDVQFSSMLSKSAFLCKALLYKSLGPAFEVIERDEMRRIAKLSQEAFAEIPADERIQYVWAISQEADFKGLVKVRLPDWYSEAISEAHATQDWIDGEFSEPEADD
jgi:hypothetical protein